MSAVRTSVSMVSASDVSSTTSSHLTNSAHRETYESAHSVMLAVFAAYSQKAAQVSVPRLATAGGDLAGYISQIIPFYTDCLLQVSALSST